MKVDRSKTAAIVTPSFSEDFERCMILAESIRICAPDLPHYIVVDKGDFDLFKPLQTGQTRLVPCEDIIARWLIKMPVLRGVWLNLRGMPVRGWILQQIIKFGAADVLFEDILVYCDSDIALIRPVTIETFFLGESVGLFDIDFRNDEIVKWHLESCKVLGLPKDLKLLRAHVGNMISWRRDIVKSVLAHIEDTHDRHWQAVLADRRSFSEYMIYGEYVRRVIGYAKSGHQPTDAPLVKASWGSDLSAPDELAKFMNEFDDETVAIMAHSKDSVDLVDLRSHLQRIWKLL